MSELVEAILRDTLHRRAEDVPSAAGVRLLAVDYHPRRSRVPIPVAPLVGLAGVTAAAVVAVVIALGVGGGPQPALAAWRPDPTPATSADRARALKQCGPGTPKVVDVRGPFVAAIYPAAGGAGQCILGPSFSLTGTAESEGGPPGPGQIQAFVSAVSAGRAGLTLLGGRVGAGVTRVRIERRSGPPITATLQHGWYMAWWPRGVHVTRAELTTASGTRSFDLPPAVTIGPPACGPNGSCASIGPGAPVGATASSGGGGVVGAGSTSAATSAVGPGRPTGSTSSAGRSEHRSGGSRAGPERSQG